MLERLGHRITRSVLVWDLALTLACLYAASTLRGTLLVGFPLETSLSQLHWPIYVWVGLIWATVFLLLVPQRALFFNSLLEAVGRLFAAVGTSSMIFAGLLYLLWRDVSRLQFLYFVVLNLIILTLFHLGVRAYSRFRQHNGSRHRVLLVGNGEQAQHLAREFARRSWTGVQIIGLVSDDPSPGLEVEHLGRMDQLPQLVGDHSISEVIFVLADLEQVTHLSLQLHTQPVMLHMVPSILDLTFPRTPVTTLGGIPMISLRESALTDAQRAMKRLFDLVGSGAIMLILLPVFAVIAVAIKFESPGPIFFLQERIGEHGHRFRMVKFRSMFVGAERRWSEVARRDKDGTLIHKIDNDPRVTRVGRKLRRTSLDELPQLINVLRGEMSLVGPRPEMPYLVKEYEPWQWQRFRVPPGMTGWWQVNGRSDKPMHLNTEDDLYYIQHYSFWLDLKILWLTIGAVIRGHGAF